MEIEIRKANEKDTEFLFELRNRPGVFQYFKNPKPVEWQEHVNWLEPILRGQTEKHLFIIEADGQKAGQVRIDIEGEIGEANVSLMPEFQGKGIAFIALGQAIEKIKKEKGLKVFEAQVHQDNISSQKLFAKLGFQLESQDDVWKKYILNICPVEEF